MAGRRKNNHQQITNQHLFQRDLILFSYKAKNELLYFYSALVRGWTFTECRHIANAFTLSEPGPPSGCCIYGQVPEMILDEATKGNLYFVLQGLANS